MSALSPDTRDDVIERIYSAASGLNPWGAALAQLSNYCDAEASYIDVLMSEPKRRLCLVGAFGHAQPLIERYHNYGYLIDPTTSHILANAGQPIQFSDLLQREIGSPAFHKEFIAARGTDHVLAIGLKSEVGMLLVKLSRGSSSQPFPESTAERLEGIAHHLRQAVVIDRAMSRRTETDSFTTSIVNRLRAAVIRLDEGLNVSFANQAAYKMANDGDLISLQSGQLSFVGREAMEAFRGFLRRATEADGDWSRTILLASADGRKRGRLWAWSSKRMLGHEIGLMILPDDFDADVLKAMLEANYGLTFSEIRTVLGVLTHNGLAAVAEHSGVSIETVRFHLKRIFSKTGTCRQSELVRVIANDLCCVDVGTQPRRGATRN